jgi:hypothetical protein
VRSERWKKVSAVDQKRGQLWIRASTKLKRGCERGEEEKTFRNEVRKFHPVVKQQLRIKEFA